MEVGKRYLYRAGDSNGLLEGTVTEASKAGEFVHVVGPSHDGWVDKSTVRVVEELRPVKKAKEVTDVRVVASVPIETTAAEVNTKEAAKG